MVDSLIQYQHFVGYSFLVAVLKLLNGKSGIRDLSFSSVIEMNHAELDGFNFSCPCKVHLNNVI